jgi:putative NADH-flavin reductase
MFTPMKIEIEHEGSCLGAMGGTGRLIVRDALAKGHSVVVLVRSKARAVELSVCCSSLTFILVNTRFWL